jgi:phosphoglycerol transferase MdoB-like AlkP superfamily enzyme
MISLIKKHSHQRNYFWGVCDEDMYNKAIGVMNKEAKENKPFFNHIMTVSHRPFTFLMIK